MSDTPPGPGWWKASDGRWYPPAAPRRPWWQSGWVFVSLIVVIVALAAAIIAAVTSSSGGDAAPVAARRVVVTTSTTLPATTTTINVEQRRAEYDAQVARSCARVAGAPLASVTREAADSEGLTYDSGWRVIASRNEFVAAIEACAAPQREARLANECAAEAPVELLNRNPDQFKGKCFSLILSITQFDQATGPCGFRARFDSTTHEYNFQFRGENALVRFSSPCPQLDPVGADDVVRARVVVVGGTQYDTAIGGTSTAVQFSPVGDIEVLVNK